MTDKEIFEAVGQLANSIEKIAHGDKHGPGGLEALAMMTSEAVQGHASATGEISTAITEGSRDISDALSSVANAIQALADATDSRK